MSSVKHSARGASPRSRCVASHRTARPPVAGAARRDLGHGPVDVAVSGGRAARSTAVHGPAPRRSRVDEPPARATVRLPRGIVPAVGGGADRTGGHECGSRVLR